ncbi:DUF4214 domain-containing protein [Pseudomonas lactis]|uniref:DUF4214 domain-containing protein n=1 Tax=Pseudomonas lactis TaxID=1615674 RepID=UPI00110C83C6|nr:DUF4214 domain-containing protein [Pseudomonas lactis]
MPETARLVIAVDSTQATSAGRDLSALERQAGTTEIGIAKLAKTATAAFAALKLGSIVEDAVTLASRYDQLGLVMKTVGANTGRTTVELAALDQSLQKAGISAIQSRNNIIKMMSANIDLAQATKLARLAQDAAVVGNTNSSDAFERLIKGIQSAEKETLETLGLNVNFQQSYEQLAKQLGKNADQLTTAEKTQAGVNAAMEAGKNIAGAYEASLDNANKKLQSSTRYVENLKVSLGGAAQPAFGVAVDGYVGSLKMLSDNVSVVSQLLETGLYAALGRGVAAAYTSAAAFTVETKAKQASATSALALAEAEAVEAAANLKATTQRYAAYASHVEVTAATNADAAAQARLAAAQKASSVTSTALMGAGGRLLGLMGGPVGLAVMAGSVALSFLDFGEETGALKARIAELDGPLDGLLTKFTKLSKIEQVNQIESLSKDLESLKTAYAKSGEDAGSAFVESLAKGMSGPRRSSITVASGELASAVESVKKAFQETGTVDWSSLLAQLSNVNGVSAEQLQIVKDLAGSREAEGRKIAEVEGRLNALTGSYKANTDAATNNAIVTDTTGQKYIDQLKRQSDFAGKLTEVEKVRISISKGYAGTLSEADQKAALAYAGTVDKANAATAATKTLTSETNKHATAVENQAKALKDLEAQSAISTKSSNDMADAYLAGADSVRELAIQQKIEEELLKTGAGARDAVTAAVNREADAKDRLDINQYIANLRVENASTVAQAAATLQGRDALESFNITKAMTIALSGKKIATDSVEYKQLLEQTKAQLDANKALEQAGKVESIVERLDPQVKLLRDYTEEQEALNAAIAQGTDKTPLYQDALAKLGLEYEQNKASATAWGKFTEGAVDRVDDAFADAWKNIDKGFKGFADSLKDGFKQLLAELAHMAITKPIIMQIGASLGVGGLSAQSSGLFGGSSGGGTDIFSLAKGANQLYSVANSGFGQAISSGWASGDGLFGGLQNAFSGGYGYVGSALGFGSGAAGAAASSGLAQGAAAYGSQFGTGIGAVSFPSAAGSAAGGAASGAASSGLSGLGAAGYGIGGALYGYSQAGLKGAATGAAGAVGGAYAGAAIGSVVPIIGTAIGAAIGSVLGGVVGGSLFGGDWQTKDQGLSLGVENGDFAGQQFEYQKKKGGLFSSNKKRTRLSALDPEMQAALDSTYDATEGSVLSLFDRLNVELNDGVLDGLNVASTKISTKDKTAEQIQEEIAKWFGGVADSMVSAVDAATGAGLGGYNFESLTTFVNNLYGVNEAIRYLNVGMFDLSVSGGKMAEQLSAMAGGLDALKASNATYYDNFYSDAEKADDSLDAVSRQFKALNIALPETREGYRSMVEALDLTTEAGRAMFVTLTGLAGNAAQAYSILEQRADAATEAAKALADELATALMGAVDNSFSAVQRSISAQQKAATAAYNATNTSLSDMSATAVKSVTDLSSVSNSLESALKSLRGTSDDAVKTLRAQAQATLQSALATARAGGSLSGFTGLEDALDTVSDNNTDLYGSMEDFARDQGRTANVVAELNAINGKQLTAAEKLQKSLETQIDVAKKAYDAQMAQYDQQLEFAQAQMDAFNGIDTSVKSVEAAIKALNGSLIASLAAKPATGAGSAMANTAANNATVVDTLYQQLFGRTADAGENKYWADRLGSGNLPYAEIVANMTQYASAADKARMAALAAGKVPGYASGGDFGGGLRLVGENGPELEVTGPSRIFNANQTASMLNGGGGNGELIAEVRQLRTENRQAQFQIVKLTQKIEQTMSQWNGEGMPQEREYAL